MKIAAARVRISGPAPGNGFLALDRNDDGRINNGLEFSSGNLDFSGGKRRSGNGAGDRFCRLTAARTWAG